MNVVSSGRNGGLTCSRRVAVRLRFLFGSLTGSVGSAKRSRDLQRF